MLAVDHLVDESLRHELRERLALVSVFCEAGFKMLYVAECLARRAPLQAFRVGFEDQPVREDEFVHHGPECELEVIVPDEEHGAFAFIGEMRLAAPCGVASVRCVVDAPLERCAALAADDSAGECVAVLVLFIALADVLLIGPLGDELLRGFTILAADDGLVMIPLQVLCLLPVVQVPLVG